METAEYKAMASVERTNWWFVIRRAIIVRTLEQLGIREGYKKSIVDIGAGTGGMTRLLERFGAVVGIEPNAHGRAHAKKQNILLKPGFANKTGLPSNSFDMVCFFDVLYHQGIDEEAALGEARRLLKKGGTLIITDCAFPFLSSPHDVHVMGRTRYTKASLCSVVRKHEFHIRYCSYTFFLMFPLVVSWRLLRTLHWKLTGRLPLRSDVTPLPFWLSMLFTFVSKIEIPFYGKFSYPWGSSIILVSQKA